MKPEIGSRWVTNDPRGNERTVEVFELGESRAHVFNVANSKGKSWISFAAFGSKNQRGWSRAEVQE